MRITLLAALDEDDAIGRSSGGLPWDLPDEKAHFRAHCAGKWLLIGRRTFAEMDGWFRDHVPLVLTRHAEAVRAPGRVVSSVDGAISLAGAAGQDELVVIGGAEVFAHALPHATDLRLTRVHAHSGGEVQFPPVDWARWRTVHERFHAADARHAHSFTIRHWVRADAHLSGCSRSNSSTV